MYFICLAVHFEAFNTLLNALSFGCSGDRPSLTGELLSFAGVLARLLLRQIQPTEWTACSSWPCSSSCQRAGQHFRASITRTATMG